MAAPRLACASAVLALWAAMLPATTEAAPVPVNTTAAVPTDTGVHDRVLALVQARKCVAAHEEAVKGGDDLLAQQVTELCGLKPSNDSGGSRSRKGGSSSGRPGALGPSAPRGG